VKDKVAMLTVQYGDEVLAGAAINAATFILLHLPEDYIASGAAALSLFISSSQRRLGR